MGTLAMALGILSMFLWPVQYCGFLVSIAGIWLGIVVIRYRKSSMAVVGIVLASLGLTLAMVNLKIGLLDLILKAYFQY